MTKCAAPKSDPVDVERPSKCIRSNDRNCTPSALNDAGAWHFLEWYLQSNLGYAQMEDGLILYLGKRYCADDWAEAKLALFSSDGDDAKAMENLAALKNKYIVPKTSSSSSVPTAAFRSKRRRLKSCIFVDSKAGEGGEDEEEEEEYEYGPLRILGMLPTLPGLSAKHTLSTKIDEIFKSYKVHAVETTIL